MKELRSKSSLIEDHKPRANILQKTRFKAITNRGRGADKERSKSPNEEGELQGEEMLPVIKLGPNESTLKYLYNDDKFGKKRSVLSYHKDGKSVRNRPPL